MIIILSGKVNSEEGTVPTCMYLYCVHKINTAIVTKIVKLVLQ